MTSSVVGASSVPLNQTDDSGGLQEVLKDIKDTKKELGEVKQEIKKLNEPVQDVSVVNPPDNPVPTTTEKSNV